MRVAIEGCCHGCLDQIYHAISKKKVELLIICGDFQSIRNKVDLECMNVPQKYKRMGSFQDYYTGKKKAPVFTIFIGGNHEASNYLDELKYGGFVAPNIYYMGRSSVIWFKGLRIGGLSGIYFKPDFLKLNPENYSMPYNNSTIRSIYHYRKDDYFKLKLLEESHKMIFVSHDWPEGIYNYGDVKKLLKMKPFFKNDVKNHCLGSPFNMGLLSTLQTNYWFSAHLHVRFVATVDWSKKRSGSISEETNNKKSCNKRISNDNEIFLDMNLMENIEKPQQSEKNNDEIKLDLDLLDNEIVNDAKDTINKDKDSELNDTKDINNYQTKFLSLDKCLPRRNYLEIMNINLTDSQHISNKNKKYPLYLDPEYISSLKVIEKYKLKLDELNYNQILNPSLELLNELKNMKNYYLKEFESLKTQDYENLFRIPLNSFIRTASSKDSEFTAYKNPQTDSFIKKFLK